MKNQKFDWGDDCYTVVPWPTYGEKLHEARAPSVMLEPKLLKCKLLDVNPESNGGRACVVRQGDFVMEEFPFERVYQTPEAAIAAAQEAAGKFISDIRQLSNRIGRLTVDTGNQG